MSIERFLPVKVAPYLLFGYHGNSYSDNLSRKMDTSVKTKFQKISIKKQSENTISGSENVNKNVFLSIFLPYYRNLGFSLNLSINGK